MWTIYRRGVLFLGNLYNTQIIHFLPFLQIFTRWILKTNEHEQSLIYLINPHNISIVCMYCWYQRHIESLKTIVDLFGDIWFATHTGHITYTRLGVYVKVPIHLCVTNSITTFFRFSQTEQWYFNNILRHPTLEIRNKAKRNKIFIWYLKGTASSSIWLSGMYFR